MARWQKILSIIIAPLVMSVVNISYSTERLYPNEKMMVVEGTEILSYFEMGDRHKPLIIFVPGNAHLARIGYGYPDGNSKDFLSYWIHKQGYPFLGVSYPTDNKVFNQLYPAFNITDWGNSIIGVAKDIIKKNHLSKNIVVVGWSMAGSVVQTVNAAAKKEGLNLKLFIGLSAVPPIPYIMQDSPIKMDKMLSNHLADRHKLYPWFHRWLKQQNAYNQHIIISENIYQEQFLGDIPIALGAEGYHYKNDKFIFDIQKTIDDSGIFNFAMLPWVAQIVDDSPETLKISVVDPYAWKFLLMQMIYQNYINNKNKWIDNKLITTIPDSLMIKVHGSHLFFVGEKGAKITAKTIEELIEKADRLEK